jgi:hypothetical protein
VLIVGGSDENDWRGRRNTAELFDETKGRFTPLSPMHAARFKIPASVVSLGNGDVLVAGGADSIERYRSSSRTFATLPLRIDTDRFYATATALRDGRVLIAGGYDRQGEATAKTWIFTR